MIRTLLSAEAQLVCLSSGGAENEAAVRALLERPLHWPTVAALAHVERAAPPLWRRLRTLSEHPAAAAGALALAPTARIWEFKLARLERLLHRLLAAFADAGIDVVLLKGAAVAHSLLGGMLARPMSDLDLMVPREQATSAWKLAQKLDWRWDAAELPWQRYEGHHHLPPLEDAAGGRESLEIHVEPLPRPHPFGLDAAGVWRRSQPVSVGGITARVPCREDLFVHTCVHWVWMHRMRSKAWRTFRDVWACGEATGEWGELAEAAVRAGAGSCAYWTLRLGRGLAGVRVPERVVRELAPPRPSWLLEALERHYALGAIPDADGCPSERLEEALWQLGVRRGQPGHEDPTHGRRPGPERPLAAAGLVARLKSQLQNAPSWRRYWRAMRGHSGT